MEQSKKPAPAPSQGRKAPTPGSWVKGQSGNPRGRAGRATSLTDAIRDGVDPQELLSIALDLARNGASESTKIAALNWLRDSGFTRPSERHELVVGAIEQDPDDDALAESLTDAELDELDRLEDERRAILAKPLKLLSSSETEG